MTFSFEDETTTEFLFNAKEEAEHIITETLSCLDCPYKTEISLLVTDDDRIKEINKEFRDIDKSTDVLSFPMVEYESPLDFSLVDNNSFNPDTDELLLGDIVISADAVLSQAKEYGHSILREYAFLIVHSVLHLFGYDHMEENERMIMEEKQKDIMKYLGINR